MNKQTADILIHLIDQPVENQRQLAEVTGYSLGRVNLSLKELSKEGYIADGFKPTEKAEHLINKTSPKNAILLAAGFGMRMVPINLTTPKPLLQVHGECLIERLIRQLNEAGVKDITVITGYRMDAFEYLIDDFNVNLIFNPDFASKNNLASLALAADKISNTYIVPCDLWCRENPFKREEIYSWYMVSDAMMRKTGVRVNRKRELVSVAGENEGNAMLGISYLAGEKAEHIKTRLLKYSNDSAYDDSFWEAALFDGDREPIYARVVAKDTVVELNTYEELRELDAGSNHLKSDALDAIAGALNCKVNEIKNIETLKKGMTNRSFLFSVHGNKYIMRIPGEGTELLVDRKHEEAVYRAIAGKEICDDVVYINAENGYKITKYLEGIRAADPGSVDDIKKCMAKLRSFHDMQLKVEHSFDIFGLIEYYESLRNGKSSVYRDYKKTKEQVFSLKPYIDEHAAPAVLAHIDSVPDNFLFCKGSDGKEELQLTDWEYAGMQDPHVDLAMFSIYSLYDKEQIDRLIDIYFENTCPEETRTKIYCYIAACGLLWSNWCEFKRDLGVEFGEYSVRQYRYAKDFYRLSINRST